MGIGETGFAVSVMSLNQRVVVAVTGEVPGAVQPLEDGGR